MKSNKALLACLLTVSAMPTSYAGIISTELATPSLTAAITVGGIKNVINFESMGQVIDEGAGTTNFTGSTINTNWDFGWNISANADPFITGNLNFTNTTATDQTFNVVLVLPTALTTGPVQETGTLGFTLSDGGDGVADLTFNQWHGLINPLTPPPILDMPLLIGSTLNCGGVNCAAILSPVSNTQLHSEADHGGNAITSIGTHLNFTLSAGDSININTKWNVAPVPVPAAVWLFMSGLIGLFSMTRLRK
jgi:hypothetical protein